MVDVGDDRNGGPDAVPGRAPTEPGLPTRPFLPSTFRVIPVGTDKVLVRGSSRVVRFTGPGVASTLTPLLLALDGWSTIEELATTFAVDAGAVERLVRRLSEHGILGPDLPTPRSAVELAAAAYYADTGPGQGWRPGTLPSTAVAFVGLGPVTRIAARHLASAGVGRAVVVDDGPVTEFDDGILLSRPGRAGARRADAAVDEWCAAAPPTEARAAGGAATESSGIETAGPVDLVVVEAPEGDRRAEEVAAQCRRLGRSALLHTASSIRATVGPLLDPSRPPCAHCLGLRRLSHVPNLEEELAYRGDLEHGGRESALLPGLASLAAGLLSNEALRALASARPAPPGRILVADFATLTVRAETVLAVPGCPSCPRPPEGGL